MLAAAGTAIGVGAVMVGLPMHPFVAYGLLKAMTTGIEINLLLWLVNVVPVGNTDASKAKVARRMDQKKNLTREQATRSIPFFTRPELLRMTDTQREQILYAQVVPPWLIYGLKRILGLEKPGKTATKEQEKPLAALTPPERLCRSIHPAVQTIMALAVKSRLRLHRQ